MFDSTPHLDATRRHLHLLADDPHPVVAWQVVDDTKQNPDLARGFHGRLDDVLPRLIRAQENGCGVFVAVNATDGKRRRIENMVHARAVFLDLDGAPLPAAWPVEPDLIIHSSSVDGLDKFQCWWFIEPTTDWDSWQRMQKAMALRYGGDLKCCMVTQVGRCPGFHHQKRRDQRWRVRIIHDSGADPAVRYTLAPLVEKFGFDLASISAPSSRRERVDRPPPMHGWDNALDVVAARRLVADEANWTATSDGGVSIYKMACKLHDFGISQPLAVELIEDSVPVVPDGWMPNHISTKVANAYQYAQKNAGAESLEADRRALADAVRHDIAGTLEAQRHAMLDALKKDADDE